MKKNHYQEPQLEIINILVEKGICTSDREQIESPGQGDDI